MQVKVNGELRETSSATLDALVAELGAEAPAVATAHNGGFVPRALRSEILLVEGDVIEMLSPMQGG
ncbi:sulfur carrier protein ThiS [Thioclava sp. BHET1]|nr:sulfur carrier protein ThiS [Thioclava sp. BHET1]